MLDSLRGLAQFIAIKRGIMLFLITLGGTFLVAGTQTFLPSLYLGAIVFCLWSFADAINNIYDKELDEISDPQRAKYTKNLGKKAHLITWMFAALTFALSIATFNWQVLVVVSVGMFLSFIYSAPPIRLRTTIAKPLVNFIFGSVAILVSGAYFGVYSFEVIALTLLFGVVTSINSIWGDLADYKSDKSNGSKTVPVVLGFRRGFIFTVILGCMLIPILTYIGLMYGLSFVYYAILAGIATYILGGLFLNKRALSKNKENLNNQIVLAAMLTKDFTFITLIFSLTFMVSALIR